MFHCLVFKDRLFSFKNKKNIFLFPEANKQLSLSALVKKEKISFLSKGI